MRKTIQDKQRPEGEISDIELNPKDAPTFNTGTESKVETNAKDEISNFKQTSKSEISDPFDVVVDPGTDGSKAVSEKSQTTKRILLFVGLTFVLTWAYWFAVSYPLAQQVSGGLVSSSLLQLSIAPAMFVPAIAVVLTRLVTREGFKPAYILPVKFKKTWKFWLMGYFGPAILIALGAAVYFLINQSDFSLDSLLLTTQLAMAGMSDVSDEQIQSIIVAQLGVAILLGPVLNFITAFGEEWGWRGYLFPKLIERFKILPTLLISGVIWGLWHAPITVLGHNYGTDYWGYPVLGILAMCVFCIVMGTFLSFITLRSGSCIPAVFAHGAINAMVNAGLLFSFTGGDPFIGPMPTGILGGSVFIVCAVVMALLLMRRERKGDSLIVTRDQ